MNPTLEQSFDILFEISHLKTCHKVNGLLPTLQTASSLVRICGHKLCRTCSHLNCSPVFSSKITKQTFPIRHKATCTSSYLIYLITCTKCRKQYVGMTTKQLNTRIHHHRWNILQNRTSGIGLHFNFPNHNIDNLSVQVIDMVPQNSPNSLQKLQSLEHYWISQLKTLDLTSARIQYRASHLCGFFLLYLSLSFFTKILCKWVTKTQYGGLTTQTLLSHA